MENIPTKQDQQHASSGRGEITTGDLTSAVSPGIDRGMAAQSTGASFSYTSGCDQSGGETGPSSLNERYQRVLTELQRLGPMQPSVESTSLEQMRVACDLRAIMDEFEHRAQDLMKRVIDELLVPPHLRTVHPVEALSDGNASGPVYIHNEIMLALLAPSIKRTEQYGAGLGLGIGPVLDGTKGGETFSVASGAWLDDADVTAASAASEERLSTSMILNHLYSESSKSKQTGSSGEAEIHVPAVCQVDYMGFRGLAKLCFPLSSTSRQVYGPATHGATMSFPTYIMPNPTLQHSVEKLCKRMNLRPQRVPHLELNDKADIDDNTEVVRLTPLETIPNLKIFACEDGRNYIPSTTGILPQDITSSASEAAARLQIAQGTYPGHLQNANLGVLAHRVVGRKLLRPELLARFRTSLSCPANPNVIASIEKWSPSMDGDVRSEVARQLKDNAAQLAAASALLHTKIIPELAQELDACNPLPSCGAWLVELMHERGINARYLGKLARASRRPHVVTLCITEMVARACKAILRSAWRRLILQHSTLVKVYASDVLAALGVTALGGGEDSLPMENKTDEDTSPQEAVGVDVTKAQSIFRQVALTIVNLVLGHGAASDDFWNAPLKRTVEYKFGFKLMLSGSTMGPRAKARAAALANAAAKAAAAATAAAEAAASAASGSLQDPSASLASATAAANAQAAAAAAAARAKAAIDHREEIHRPTLFLALQRELGLVFRDAASSRYAALLDSDVNCTTPIRDEDLLSITMRVKSSVPDLLRAECVERSVAAAAPSSKDTPQAATKPMKLLMRFLAIHLPPTLSSKSMLWVENADENTLIPWSEWQQTLCALLAHPRTKWAPSHNIRPMVAKVVSLLLSLMLKGTAKAEEVDISCAAIRRTQAFSIANFMVQHAGLSIAASGQDQSNFKAVEEYDDGIRLFGYNEGPDRPCALRKYDMVLFPYYLAIMQVAFSASRTSGAATVKTPVHEWFQYASPFARFALNNTSLAPATESVDRDEPSSWTKSQLAVFAADAYATALATHSFCLGNRQPHAVLAHAALSALHELALETALAALVARRAAIAARKTLGADHDVSLRLRQRWRTLSTILRQQKGESVVIASTHRTDLVHALAGNADSNDDATMEEKDIAEKPSKITATDLMVRVDEFAAAGLAEQSEDDSDSADADAENAAKYLQFLSTVIRESTSNVN